MRFLSLAFAGVALAALYFAAPGFAQDTSVEADPFAGVSAVDGEHMSAVSGQPGAAELPGGYTQNAGAACDTACGNAAHGDIGSPVTEHIRQGNSFTVNVTASNHQTTIVGPGAINTGGGLNTQGGN